MTFIGKWLPLILQVLLFFHPAGLYPSGSADLELDVPWFGQTKEERWGREFLGTSQSLTIHTHGCALTTAAMVLKYYKVSTNPEKLNNWLIQNNGFDDGWDDDTGEYLGKVRILWNIPVEKMDQIGSYRRIDFSESPADTDLIRNLLKQGIPLIAEVRRPGWIPHFVVICGFKGEDFLIRDPLNRKTRFLSEQYNIDDEYGSGPERNIYGLRIYEAD